MATYFLDSSAVVKRYQPELGSEEVARILSQPESQFFISRLTVVEVQRALVGKVRAKAITTEELDQFRHRFYTDIQQRLFRIRELQSFHYNSAVRLVRRYGPEEGSPLVRSLDAIQLAAALDLRNRISLDYFVSADKAQCEAAAAEKLQVLDPTLG